MTEDGGSSGASKYLNTSQHSPRRRPITQSQSDTGVPLSSSKNALNIRENRHPESSRELHQIRPGRVKHVIIPPDAARMVRRELTGLQLFMITFNGTLGTGLYWSGGRVLTIGGPLAAFLSFLIIGGFAWSVMQAITEMLCIWPVPSALSVYVSTFVDEELGLAVGVAYWFTYSVAFSALLAAAADEVAYWDSSKSIRGAVMFGVLPIVCIGLNWFAIEIYGRIETIVGYFKILFYLLIGIFLCLIINGVGPQPALHDRYWSNSTYVLHIDEELSGGHWGLSFMTCLFLSSFAYVGIEIVAASALEARWDHQQSAERDMIGPRTPSQAPMVSKGISRAAKYFSIIVGVFYSLGILLVSFAIRSDHCYLSGMSYATTYNCSLDDETIITSEEWQARNLSSASPFVAAARKSQIPGLHHTINAFIIFTAIFCASTNLYVASRTMFALTSGMSVGPGQNIAARFFANLGKTNDRGVPVRALLFSAIAFWWVPVLQLADKRISATSGPGKFNEVLTAMSSLGVLIVWACNLLAFIRFYHSIDRYQDYDEMKKFPETLRNGPDYPFKSNFQPYLSYCALMLCIFLILIAGAPAAFYPKFQLVPFLSTYLTFMSFVGLWLGLKWARGASSFWVDLSKPQHLAERLQRLHDIRYRGIEKAARKSWSRFVFGS